MKGMWSKVPGTLVLLAVVLMAWGGLGATSSPTSVGGLSASALPAPLAVPAPAATPTSSHSASHPLDTFQRTVLIETFTGTWCIHCPAESIGLHNMDETTNRSSVIIAELHVCALPTDCLENYVPPDNTSTLRGTFYNVCGFPDVFFDGLHDQCGATNSASQMEGIYNSSVHNATLVSANLSISQSAYVGGGNIVIDHANVTSGVTGTFTAITYLMEYVDKMNVNIGYGPHDVDHVVRATLMNHLVNLVAGQTTSLTSVGTILPAWNARNLSVVTFIQLNSTKQVYNSNMATVTTLTSSVASNVTTAISGTTTQITVQATNSSTGLPVMGANVSLTSSAGGSFSPSSGTTSATGTFTSTFTAPTVSTSQNVVVWAQISAAGYTGGSSETTLVVTPVVLPLSPTSLLIGPGNLSVGLSWTAPATGAAGLTYHIYRATSSAGSYTEVGTATGTTFTDTGVSGGQSYWYTVSAENAFGFSPNTTALPVTAITAHATGLASDIGWWLSVDGATASSATNTSLYLFVPSGFYAFTFGPTSYAYLAPSGTGTVTASGVSLQVAAEFAPRYANLQGTVSPANATVTLDGVPITVSGGAFNELEVAGDYSLAVSSPGYVSSTQLVNLTPGNLTNVPVVLVAEQSPGGGSTPVTSSGGGLTTTDALVIVIGVVALVGIVGAAIVISRRRAPAPISRSPPEMNSPEE